jgi:hypothetical protein
MASVKIVLKMKVIKNVKNLKKWLKNDKKT